ncbi:hypothetical protein Tco_1530066, partial [Tanacetum coccineum]
MVAYLKKPEGSEGFHQIVDFLNASHIRYALTEYPTIYVSLIKQFWETTTARTLDNKEIELKLRLLLRHPFIQVFLNKHKRLLQPHTRLYIAPTHTQKLFSNIKRASKGYTGEDIPLFPTMIVQGPVVQGKESTHPPRSPTQTPIVDEVASAGVDIRYGGATTTVTGLEYDTTRIDGFFCTTLSKNVESLETDLKQTKQLYGVAYTKLIKKVKKLEKIVKSSIARRRARIVVSDDEDYLEDPSKQGRKIAKIDQDPDISLVQHDANIQGRY